MPGQGHGLQLDDNLPRRLRSDGNAKDIFVMVKQSMSDAELCQAPLCVYPHSLLASTEAFFNGVNVGNTVLTQRLEDSRMEELNELASAMEADFPHLIRGVRYLRQLTFSQSS